MGTKTELKKLSHKEKYGKVNSRGSKSKFNPVVNGFYSQVPSQIPEGYNYILGYCTETVTAAQRKQKRKYL
jgi:hypothetical protein